MLEELGQLLRTRVTGIEQIGLLSGIGGKFVNLGSRCANKLPVPGYDLFQVATAKNSLNIPVDEVDWSRARRFLEGDRLHVRKLQTVQTFGRN